MDDDRILDIYYSFLLQTEGQQRVERFTREKEQEILFKYYSLVQRQQQKNREEEIVVQSLVDPFLSSNLVVNAAETSAGRQQSVVNELILGEETKRSSSSSSSRIAAAAAAALAGVTTKRRIMNSAYQYNTTDQYNNSYNGTESPYYAPGTNNPPNTGTNNDWYSATYSGTGTGLASSFPYPTANGPPPTAPNNTSNSTNNNENLLCPGDAAAGGDVNTYTAPAVTAGYTLQQPPYPIYGSGGTATAADVGRALTMDVNYNKLVDSLCGPDYHHHPANNPASAVASALYPFQQRNVSSASPDPAAYYPHYFNNNHHRKYDSYSPTSASSSEPVLFMMSSPVVPSSSSSSHRFISAVPTENEQYSTDNNDKEQPEEEQESDAAAAAAASASHTKQRDNDDQYSGFTLNVPGVSLEPMTAREMLDRINLKTDEVVTRYLPCVDFLVACQQELRAGLSDATRKVRNSQYYSSKNHHAGRYRDAMTPRQFFNRYVAPLGKRFLQQNEPIMPTKELHDAYNGIQGLVDDAKKEISISCESIKNIFLGGMRDGESWGLRKWLSQHGGALKICNDLELIYGAIKTQSKESDEVNPVIISLAEIIRPKAKQAYDRLQNDVPSAYQQISSAHPYLPFFHRLESALRSMSTFDPEEDDVICLDDSSDEDEVDIVEEVKSSSSAQRTKREIPTTDTSLSPPRKRNKISQNHKNNSCTNTDNELDSTLQNSDGDGLHHNFEKSESDNDSDIEVVGVKPAYGSSSNKANEDDLNEEENTNITSSSSVPQHSCTDNKLTETKFEDKDIDDQQQHVQTEEKDKKTGDWRCPQCTFLNISDNLHCVMCNDDYADGEQAVADEEAVVAEAGLPINFQVQSDDCKITSALELANKLGKISEDLEKGIVFRPLTLQASEDISTDFWNTTGQLVYVLKVFRLILFESTSKRHVNSADKTEEYQKTIAVYDSLVRTSLCFSDIVEVLTDGGHVKVKKKTRGKLKPKHLSAWNMFNARDLVQAIDLVFLNSLCYEGKSTTSARIETKRLRKLLWDNIILRGGPAKITKRSETSGFVTIKRGSARKG